MALPFRKLLKILQNQLFIIMVTGAPNGPQVLHLAACLRTIDSSHFFPRPHCRCTRVGTLIVATIYLQLIQN